MLARTMGVKARGVHATDAAGRRATLAHRVNATGVTAAWLHAVRAPHAQPLTLRPELCPGPQALAPGSAHTAVGNVGHTAGGV